MVSSFDPNVFLHAQTTEVNEKRPPLPADNPAAEDALYLAVIGEIKTASGTIEKGDRAGQPGEVAQDETHEEGPDERADDDAKPHEASKSPPEPHSVTQFSRGATRPSW